MDYISLIFLKSNSFYVSGELAFHQLPSYVYIEVPAMRWELKQKTLESLDPSPVYSASHRIVSINLLKRTLSSKFPSLKFDLFINEHDRRGISDTLAAIRDAHLNDLIMIK